MQNNNPEPTEEADRLAGIVVDAALAVHRALGPGYSESIYEEALSIELTTRQVSFERQKPVRITYRDQMVGEGRLDFLVGSLVVVELKAVESFAPVHQSQVLSYLKMTGFNLGLLINFNVPLLKNGIRRIVSSPLPLAPWRLAG